MYSATDMVINTLASLSIGAVLAYYYAKNKFESKVVISKLDSFVEAEPEKTELETELDKIPLAPTPAEIQADDDSKTNEVEMITGDQLK